MAGAGSSPAWDRSELPEPQEAHPTINVAQAASWGKAPAHTCRHAVNASGPASIRAGSMCCRTVMCVARRMRANPKTVRHQGRFMKSADEKAVRQSGRCIPCAGSLRDAHGLYQESESPLAWHFWVRTSTLPIRCGAALPVQPGATEITEPGRRLVDLPGQINHRWTKLFVSPRHQAVRAVGSNSMWRERLKGGGARRSGSGT